MVGEVRIFGARKVRGIFLVFFLTKAERRGVNRAFFLDGSGDAKRRNKDAKRGYSFFNFIIIQDFNNKRTR